MEGGNRMLNKLSITILLGILLSLVVVSATSMSIPSQSNINSNFDLQITGNGFYALEMNIPSIFQIVSDQSGGIRNGDIYKTVTTGNLKIVLRTSEIGTYTISGRFTDGNGVQNLNTQSIQINDVYAISPSCPVCPLDTSWSNCDNGNKIRYTYSCSPTTNYLCITHIENQACQTISNNCESKWICKDQFNIAYQSTDCSLSSVQNCPNGCDNGNCIKSTTEPSTPLTVTINGTTPSSNVTIYPKVTNGGGGDNIIKESSQNIIVEIINFFKNLVNSVISWISNI